MAVIGIGNETYLFVNGLVVNKEILLHDSISLLPVNADFDYTSASKLIKSDIDYSIVVLSASNLYSQMKINANNGEELAKKAWNAQWDCLLLGAILNNSIMCNLQCDKPVEMMKDSEYLCVTNYGLHGIKRPSVEISETEEEWIKNYYNNAYKLLENPQFQTAVHCMSSYLWHSLPRAQLAILWAGIEALFEVSNEISFRLSLYIANFLAGDKEGEAKDIFEKTRKLYSSRSLAVHGGKIKGDTDNHVLQAALLLNRLIIRCAEIGSIPNTAELVFPNVITS